MQIPTLTDRDADGVRDTVTFALGDVLNNANNIEDAGDLITIEVVARARNQASNTAGDLLVNTGTVSGTATNTLDDASLTLAAFVSPLDIAAGLPADQIFCDQ